MAARFGKSVIPQYKAALAKAEDWMSGLDAALALAAIGIRHASAAGEVRRIFESLGEKVEDPKNSAEMRGNMGCALLDVMTREGEYLEAGTKMGRELATKLSGHLPVGHPLRFDTHGDVPDDVARTALLFLDGDMFDPRVQQLAVAALSTSITRGRSSAPGTARGHPRRRSIV
jgi:hypothetical protein